MFTFTVDFPLNMEASMLDARTKIKYKEAMIGSIMHEENQKLSDHLTSLIMKNSDAMGRNTPVIFYKNQILALVENPQLVPPKLRDKVHPDLTELFDEYLKAEASTTILDRKLTRYINRMLMKCETRGDMLAVCSSQISQHIPDIAWDDIIEDDEMAQQYKKRWDSVEMSDKDVTLFKAQNNPEVDALFAALQLQKIVGM